MKRLGGVKRPWLPGDDSGGESEGQDALTTHGFGIGNADYDSAEFVAGAPPPQQQQPSGGEALPADNVGRVIAERLGYVAGRGLGRREDGRLAPVEAVQRTRRAGLGVDEAARESRDASAAASALREVTCEDFRARSSAAQARRELRRAHASALSALEKLDRAAGVSGGEELLLLSADDVDALQDAELREQLARMCRRLRETHAYCTFCGRQFASAADMLSTCPGEHADDH